MPTIVGVNFGCAFFGEVGGELQPWRNRAEHFAENSEELKF